MAAESPSPSITCKLGALSAGQRARHAALVRALTCELPTAIAELEPGFGYEFVYQRDDATLAMLTEWMALESECCEFFAFEIAIAPQHGPVRLRWHGPDAAAKAIITTTMAAAREAGS